MPRLISEESMETTLLQTLRADRARSHDLGNGTSQRVASALGVDQGQEPCGQAPSVIKQSLWRKRRGTHQKLDESDQKQ